MGATSPFFISLLLTTDLTPTLSLHASSPMLGEGDFVEK
jgi:hypothetical protein